jgi:hypothetical protein
VGGEREAFEVLRRAGVGWWKARRAARWCAELADRSGYTPAELARAFVAGERM